MNAEEPSLVSSPRRLSLLPEEDAIGEPDEGDDDQDDMLPADLWY